MKSIITLVLIFISSLTYADSEFLEMMVQGKYLLVGKAVDSDDTYHGKIEISSNDNELVVSRSINNKTIYGKAEIEPALGGDTKVLRIRFTQDKVNYEQTCMVSSDLDNYARISCYLYEPNVRTKQPGLEVLFNDHTAK